MISKTQYEKISSEAGKLLQSVNAGELSVPRITKLLKELTGDRKPKKDIRQILESKIK
jgi:flagellar biosynthesis component FlhA